MGNRVGNKHSEETKRKIANSHIGIRPTSETRVLLSNIRKEKIKRGEVKCFGHGLSPSFAKEKNARWRGGLTQQKYPKEFNEDLKKSIRQRDNNICQMCFDMERKKKKLSIHHINYIKNDCSPINLIALCHQHHSMTHHNREFWEKLLSYFNTLKEVRGDLPEETTQVMKYFYKQ